MKDYLILLITTCAPENGFAQDAIEHALMHGWIPELIEPEKRGFGEPAANPIPDTPAHRFTDSRLNRDVALVMARYDAILERYRAGQTRHHARNAEIISTFLAGGRAGVLPNQSPGPESILPRKTA